MTAPVSHAAEAGAGADLLFDEAFLRRLEQLELASRRLTAGRMKGERRSVRRGQSVEFADYRNYSAGDDLRQLDWNVYARLERLFIKLFVEEEDVTVTLLIDASASMAAGRPSKLVFAKLTAVERPVDQPGEIDRTEEACAVRRQHLLAARIAGADRLAIAEVVARVHAVDEVLLHFIRLGK